MALVLEGKDLPAPSRRFRPKEGAAHIQVLESIDTLAANDASTDLPWIEDAFLQRVAKPFPWLSRYLRLRIEGTRNIPDGACILVANHTGCFGLDYALAAVGIRDRRGRWVRGLVHPAWFRTRWPRQLASSLGLAAASKENLHQLLGRSEAVLMFPEGEEAAFKPTLYEPKYRLREFRRGFIRAALARGAPILPVAILGGEESHPTIGRIDSTRDKIGIPLPIPLTLFPLPVKWRIRVLPPVRLRGYGPTDANNGELVHSLAAKVRHSIQAELEHAARDRGNPYV